MRKIIVTVLLILCFSFTCLAEENYSVITDYDGSQINFNTSDNSNIYVSSGNFFPYNTPLYSFSSNGIYDCPLHISSNIPLSFTCRAQLLDGHISSNCYVSWTIHYSDGTTSSDRYVYYDSKKNSSLLKASPYYLIKFSLSLMIF